MNAAVLTGADALHFTTEGGRTEYRVVAQLDGDVKAFRIERMGVTSSRFVRLAKLAGPIEVHVGDAVSVTDANGCTHHLGVACDVARFPL